MPRTVLIRGARQLLTLHGPTGPRRGEAMRQLGIIEDGAILISDGIITNVGPTRRIENLAAARSAEDINAAGRVVMPGFVDSHTHLIAAPPRLAESRAPVYPGCGTGSRPQCNPSEHGAHSPLLRSVARASGKTAACPDSCGTVRPRSKRKADMVWTNPVR